MKSFDLQDGEQKPYSVAPFLSVIVPVHQGASVLPRCLSALTASDLARETWELIVVDDASSDDSPLIAAQYADKVVRLTGKPRGPAYARNRGFEVSRGRVVVFVDADVCVHADTLGRFATLFTQNGEISAAFGAYDTNPIGKSVVSQYRNLLHHYVHQQNAGEAETFWAGCGAIRGEVFAEVGMFDEYHYSRPQIEDIELGRRLRRRGHRILLRPEIQGTHLKDWTFWDVLRTDFRSRGIPWMWLVLREGATAASRVLNLKTREKWCTALSWLAVLSVAVVPLIRSPWPLGIAGLSLGTVLVLGRDFYRFLRRERGLGFALAVIPYQIVYYLSNGLSVVLAWLLYELFGKPMPPVDVEARAEIGSDVWPPSPSRPSGGLWED